MRIADLVVKGDLDRAVLQRDQVRLALSGRLPFRLPVGKSLCIPIDWDGHHDIWFLNSVGAFEEVEQPRRGRIMTEVAGTDRLFTDAVVVVRNLQIEEPELEVLRDARNDGDPAQCCPLGAVMHAASAATEALNRAITAYNVATGYHVGIAPLRRLTVNELAGVMFAVAPVVCRADYPLSNEDLQDIAAAGIVDSPNVLTSQPFPLDPLPKVPPSDVHAALGLLREHVHYDLAFRATSAMELGDLSASLLMAVSALEGAVAALARSLLEPKLKARGQSKGLVGSLLREQGIHTFVQIAPILLMAEGEGPTAEDLKQCIRAIETRNDIVHAKKGATELSDDALAQGTHGALRAYVIYAAALEKHLGKESYVSRLSRAWRSPGPEEAASDEE